MDVTTHSLVRCFLAVVNAKPAGYGMPRGQKCASRAPLIWIRVSAALECVLEVSSGWVGVALGATAP